MGRKKISDREEIAIRELFDNKFTSKRKALDAAGYSKENSVGKVFNKPTVKAEIEIRQKNLARKHNINQDQIVDELVKIGFSGVGDLIEVNKNGDATLDFKKLTPAHRAGIKSFTTKVYTDGKGQDAREVKETKVEFISKLSALDYLSKHLGLFEKDNDDAKGLIEALVSARKRVRIGIQIDGE